MIERRNDSLVFSFPEVHRRAQMSIDFQRTLRIPDTDEVYSLPPGLGSFPLRAPGRTNATRTAACQQRKRRLSRWLPASTRR